MTRVGFLGAGTVGAAAAQLLSQRKNLSASLSKMLVRDAQKPREGVSADAVTTDPAEVLDTSDIVVEVMGGTGLAAELTLQALQAGKRVVTANKAVLAERWDELAPFVAEGKLYFEAAVMAGTPVIGPLTNALRGSRPLELHAILNGTCNYILGELEKGTQYETALAEAQRLGYAEADPTLDVEGFDAAHKLTVLARLVFDPETKWETVESTTKGISQLTPEQVQDAEKRGGKVRLLGSVYPEEGKWQARVRPVFLPDAHPVASAASNRNALYYRGDAVGEVLITGAGAGGMPTASGVVADLLTAVAGRPGPSLLDEAAPVPGDVVGKLEEV